MKTKNENLVQNDKLAREALLVSRIAYCVSRSAFFFCRKASCGFSHNTNHASRTTNHASRFTCLFVFGCSFLAVCLITSGGHAETSLEHLDPINLLEAQLAADSQRANTSNAPARTEASAVIHRTPDGWHPADLRVPETPIRTAETLLKQHKTQTGSSTTVNSDAGSDEKSTHLPVEKETTTTISRQLWQAEISNPEDKNSSESKSRLHRIIEKIRSLEFKPHHTATEPLIVVGPIQQKAESNETLSHSQTMQQLQSQKTESGDKPSLDSERQNENWMPYQPVTDETLQILEDLSQHHQQPEKPFELAEVLFNSGRLKEAAKYYRQALNRMTEEQTGRNEDRAWILFQIGNCLRNTDPPTAIEMYRLLIAEYGDLPWAHLAKAHSKLINWYQQDKPEVLIAENRF